jgi:ribonuclease III
VRRLPRNDVGWLCVASPGSFCLGVIFATIIFASIIAKHRKRSAQGDERNLMKEREITALEAELGYQFRQRTVIEQAVTHSSQAREQEAQEAGENKYKVRDNEQLEFLGDAVLSLVTSEELFQRFPHFREGELSKLRAHLVSERHLIRVAQKLELGHYLRLGRGEEKSGGRGKTALLVDALEAILAAMYLDGGLEVARQFVLTRVIAPELARMESQGGALPVTDFKSALQETVQGLGLAQPAYVLVEEAGPEHNKTFTVEARLNSKNGKEAEFVGRARGSTKKMAEQDAARQLLTVLAARSGTTEGKSVAKASPGVDK